MKSWFVNDVFTIAIIELSKVRAANVKSLVVYGLFKMKEQFTIDWVKSKLAARILHQTWSGVPFNVVS